MGSLWQSQMSRPPVLCLNNKTILPPYLTPLVHPMPMQDCSLQFIGLLLEALCVWSSVGAQCTEGLYSNAIDPYTLAKSGMRFGRSNKTVPIQSLPVFGLHPETQLKP